MLGIRDAGHISYNPDAPALVIVPISCPVPDRSEGAPSLSGKLKITLKTDSLAFRLHQRRQIEEEFHCNNGLNPDFQDAIDAGGLRIVGLGEDGEARIVELPSHPFLLATLFIPQLTSTPDRPSPLILAFLKAALSFNLSFKKSRRAAAQMV